MSSRSWLLLLLWAEQEAFFHYDELDIIAGCPRREWHFPSTPSREPLTGWGWVTHRQVLIQLLISSGSHIWKIHVVQKEKNMKRGMGSLHELFPSELGEGGMLKIGTGALAGQRARGGTTGVVGTSDMGQGQDWTAITSHWSHCGLTSLKRCSLLCVSLTQHKEGCRWILILSLEDKNTLAMQSTE